MKVRPVRSVLSTFLCVVFICGCPGRAKTKQAATISEPQITEEESATAINDWENIEVTGRNKELAHCTAISYPDKTLAELCDISKSPYYKLLNGNWKFNWVRKPADRPVDFYKTDFDDRSWSTIPVPSNWQLQGHGSAIYLNTQYPYPKDQPHIANDWNPVGSYRTEFTVDANWDGREIFINFDGVESAFYLWINGKKVGYSQGSRTPAEFNITKYLKKGKNALAAEVYRWSDGSYLECQDFWRLSGIFRDVYLVAAPKTHLQDFFVASALQRLHFVEQLLV